MKFEIVIATEDLDIIQEHIEYFQKVFPRFEILSEHFSVDNDPTVEYTGGADIFTFKEAIFQLDSANNLWAMAKIIQNFKLTGEFQL